MLAVLLLDPGRIAEVAAALEPADFAEKTNRILRGDAAAACRRQLERGECSCGHAALERWSLSVVVFLPLAAASASAQILLPGATPTKLTTRYVFTEDALYDPTGGVYFEDMHPSGQVATNPSHMMRSSVVDPSSRGANGLYYNENGQIVSADRGAAANFAAVGRQCERRSAGAGDGVRGVAI